jgi:hypothetical protein
LLEFGRQGLDAVEKRFERREAVARSLSGCGVNGGNAG